MSTGRAKISMPKVDLELFYVMICNGLSFRGVRCEQRDEGPVLYAPGIASMSFNPVSVQIDHVVYRVPLSCWFTKLNDSDLLLNVEIDDDQNVVFGV